MTQAVTRFIADINAAAAALHADVVLWRRHMHKHAELSYREFDTADFVAQRLAEFRGLEISRPTRTSVVARLAGGRPGATLAIRADIDALAIQEQNTCEYASVNAGVMHACGHDGHAAMLLGAAQILAARRAEVPGEVRFIFQHAEEQHPGGAEELVRAGVMDGVDRIVSAHLVSTLDLGKVVVLDGPALASSDRFKILIQGKGGHASMPNDCVDSLLIGAQVAVNLQHIVARNTDALDALVLSVTRFDAGTGAFNVIPEQAELWGSVRCFNEALRARVPERIEQIVRGLTSAHGASYALEYIRGYRAVVNDPAVAALLRTLVADALAPAQLAEGRPQPGSEDFSAYLQKAPGAYVLIGARNAAKGIVHPHHHPHFDIDEDAMGYGVRLFALAPYYMASTPP